MPTNAVSTARPVEHITLHGFSGRWRHHQNTLLLVVLSGYLILDYGFMLLRVPVPGLGSTGVPVGQGVLLLSLLVLPFTPVVQRLRETVGVAPLIAWWGLGGLYLAAALWQSGGYGLRNGSLTIDSLFLLLGVQFMLVPGAAQRLTRWMAWTLAIGAAYGLTYLVRDQLQPIAPRIINTQGLSVPILFTYLTAAPLLLLATASLLLFQRNVRSRSLRWAMTAAGLLTTACALIPFQARTAMLQAVMIWLLFLFLRRDVVWRYTLLLVATVAIVPLIDVLDAPIRPRITEEITADFYVGQAMSAVGLDAIKHVGEREETSANTLFGLQASHGGWGWRMELWQKAYAVWAQDWKTRLFGVGYAEPLIRAKGRGFELRQPHNSYLSTLGKLGAVGLAAWVWLHVMLVGVWWRAWRRCERDGQTVAASWLLLAGVFAAMVLLHAVVEDTFSKPYYMIPYHFLIGAALGWIAGQRIENADVRVSPADG